MEDEIKTIEGLAAMIQRNMASKEDVQELATKVDSIDAKVEHLGVQVDNLDARVARIQMDIHELRGEIVYRHEFEDVLGRVKYLEKKLGIESGVKTP